jgi:GDP/UDP-N,N'-diacetylbacillosamine 2-epimerase (hydrolysing)
MRKVCVFTSTRAEYGLLRRLIRQIDNASDLLLQLVVSGAHLSIEQGMTISEIRADGFDPDHAIEMHLLDDSPAGICRSMGVAIAGYGKSLIQLQPDILVILGDRYEALCCAAAAQICQVPIAHIHGGETTVGSTDEAFRHSITKMSHLHFPSCEEYLQRIIQLGESPARVFNVGSLGVENIKKMKLMKKIELESSIKFNLDRPFFLITFHPVTLESDDTGKQFRALLEALARFQTHKCIFTYANSDTNGQTINRMINGYVERNSVRCRATPSLGLLRYLSAMKLCDAVIGNSSSGIMEAPSFRVPTVNIGDRQKGRIRAKSVIDCSPDLNSIYNAIAKSLSSEFKKKLGKVKNPFSKSNTARAILEKLKVTDLDNILKKRFYDL